MSESLKVVQYVMAHGPRSLVTVNEEHERQLRDAGRLIRVVVQGRPGQTRAALDRWIVESGRDWERQLDDREGSA